MASRIPTDNQHDERGAATVFTLLMLTVTLAVSSFVINIGSDRIVRRDLQSAADVVALDLARELNGGPAGGNWNVPTKLLEDAKKASLQRQGWHLDDPTKNRFVNLNADNVQVQMLKRDPAAASGVDPTQVNLVPVTSGSDVPIAVRVTVAGTSAFRMLPDFWRNGRASDPDLTTAHIDRSAVAVIGRPLVCISAGSTLAELTPEGNLDLLLSRLLWGSTTTNRISVVGSGGVLSAQIPLGPLATQLGVGTVDNLMTANVTAQNFVAAAATVLSNNGNLASATALNTIKGSLNGSTALNVGSILNLNTGAGSAANLNLDAFSLVQSVIEVSNKNTFVNLAPQVKTGLANIALQAQVIQAPQIACGPAQTTTAKSAQVQLKLTTDVNALGGLVASAKVNDLLLTVAQGSGTITSITCSPSGATVGVHAKAAAGSFSLRLIVGLLLNLATLEVKVPDPAVEAEHQIANSEGDLAPFSFPTGATTLPGPQTFPQGQPGLDLGLGTLNPKVVVTAGLVLNLSSVISTIVKPLLGIINPLVSSLLDDVLTTLGLRIGTVQIQPTTLPACNEPVLRG